LNPTNFEDPLKLDSRKCLSNNDMPPTPALQPSVAAPNENVISIRSRSSTPSINMKESQNPSFPWKTDFVTQCICLLPSMMIEIVDDIPAGPKKLFMVLRT
jgi:hypothetical protein